MKKSFKMGLLGAMALLIGACGEVRNPFAKPVPFLPTPVPADFAVVLDEAADTYYARQDIRQVVSAADLMSHTTYTTHRDYNNTLANQFTTDHPLNGEQLQAMWNEVARYDLMKGGRVWYYWETNPDNYRRQEGELQIRANGKTVSYKQLNHWGYKLRDLTLMVESVRFPLKDSMAPVAQVAPPATQPQTPPPAAATQEGTVIPAASNPSLPASLTP